jgi:hypothetical protein
MSATGSDQDAMGRFEKERDRIVAENKHDFDAIISNNISKTEKIFKDGGIKQDAVDFLIFNVKSMAIFKLFLRYGGDMRKPGPPLHPHPVTLLVFFTSTFSSLVIGVQRLIKKGIKL